jgi:hypothetical protein
MPDEWESAHGLDPASDDAALDPDQDGMSNEEEYNGGWDPQAPEIAAKGRCTSAVATVDTGACLFGFGTDTDGDGMPDWWEIKYGLKRLLDDADADLDHDGLSNLTEYRLGTLPNGDGLSDMVWAMSLEFLLDTIGISPDTDGDGMRDWWEIAHGLNHLVDDSGLDPDEDGWTNLEEYNANTDPHVDDCLGPSMAASLDFLTDTGGFNGGYADDMDGDGMPDWWEIKYNLLPTVNDSAGNPDGDALNNLEEYNAGTNPRAFDFLLVEDAEGNLFVLDTGGRYYDADGDGMPNWWERLYCGSVTNMEAETDSDGDGYSNLAEYISRCSPTNRCSVFAAQDAKASESGEDWVVWWDTAPDRIYSVYSHTNLLTRWPADPIYEVQGDGQPKCYTNAVHGTVPRFFRIGVRLAPHP